MAQGPAPADDVRDRILDAATQCLLESGLDARLHAAIAERAGLSRPTLYKYVGDQTAILDAVRDREIEDFFTAAVPLLSSTDDLRTGLVDAVVFVVEYGRQHMLLQKALREHPELILPALTTESGPLVDRIHGMFAEQLERALAAVDADLDTRVVVEWIYRIIVSLITTPSGPRTESPERLREYIDGLVQLSGFVAAAPVRR
ncbi:MAG TPA: TetR/AcrR family transcriptional regulator [Nocardioidaceae bacterium]|nr:TetR/AcrR family transcriptional regulator [Nocardioidaceae bacterium]